MHYGWPALECFLKLKFSLAVNLAACDNLAEIYATFSIYFKVELCLGGTLGDLAFLIGWTSHVCQEIIKIEYFPFIGRLYGHFNIPVWSIGLGVRAQFSIGGPVHEFTQPVNDLINSACNTQWTVNAWAAACPGCPSCAAMAPPVACSQVASHAATSGSSQGWANNWDSHHKY
jgi:hypothetical protein